MSLTTPPGNGYLIRYKGERQITEKDFDWEKSSSFDSGRRLPVIISTVPSQARATLSASGPFPQADLLS
jgi:hypothetical protein